MKQPGQARASLPIGGARAPAKLKIKADNNKREKVVEAALGLTADEAENVFAKTLVQTGQFDINIILVLLMDDRLNEARNNISSLLVQHPGSSKNSLCVMKQGRFFRLARFVCV